VRWEDDHKIDAISLTSVCKPSQLVQLYETYTIQIRDWQRQGQIIFIGNFFQKEMSRLSEIHLCLGSKNDCELLQQDHILPVVTLINSRIESFQDIDDSMFFTAYQLPITETMENKSTEMVTSTDSPQVPPEQSEIHDEKVLEM